MRLSSAQKNSIFFLILRDENKAFFQITQTQVFALHLEKVTFLRGAGQSDEVLQSKPGISPYFVLPSAELHLNFFEVVEL